MEEKEKSNVRLGNIILEIIALILVLGIAYCAIQNYKLRNNIQIAETQTAESLSITDELVTKLYNYTLKYNNIGGVSDQENTSNELKESFYKDNKVAFDTLSDDEKIIVVLNNIDEKDIEEVDIKEVGFKKLTEYNEMTEAEFDKMYEQELKEMDYCKAKVYKKDKIEEAARKIFGDNSKNIAWKSIYCCGYNVDYADGNYYWYSYQGGGLGNCTFGYGILQNAEKQGNYIYLYDKYIFGSGLKAWTSEEQGKDIEYYTSSEMSKIVPNIEPSAKYEDKDSYTALELESKDILENNKDKFNTYKHTFEKSSDGEYHWVSSEIVK